ncbi:MAG: GNAT family N-acetyltransferase [Rhizobiales bacterium]|nr:GNAT family N-acetyltransferase [Hyphomicrobiales bacterium]
MVENSFGLAVSCLPCPSFWYGNILHLFNAPDKNITGDELSMLWDEHVAKIAPNAPKKTIGWELPHSVDYQNIRNEFELDISLMLKYDPDIDAQKVANHKVVALKNHQWKPFFNLHQTINGVEADDFTIWQHSTFKTFFKNGVGQQFVIWDGDQIAAAAGLAWQGTIYRYQMVATREIHRRRGYASAIIAYIRDFALERGATEIYLGGEKDSHAAGIYQRAGFKMDSYVYSILADRSNV